MYLCVDTLRLIYCYCKEESPFLSLLSTNKEYHELKTKFRYNKKYYLCDNKDWNEKTISYFHCVSWVICARNKREIKNASIHTDALQVCYNHVLKRNIIPKHIKRLYFYDEYKALIQPGNIPNTITFLKLPKSSKQLLDDRFIPGSVKTVFTGNCKISFFLLSRRNGFDNLNIETLVFNSDESTIYEDRIPKSVKKVVFTKKYYEFVKLPSSKADYEIVYDPYIDEYV